MPHRVAPSLFTDSFCHVLWQHVDEALFIYPLLDDDTPGHFELINRFACITLGFCEEELQQMKLADLDDPELGNGGAGQNMKTLLDHKSSLFDTMHRHKNGMILPARVHLLLMQVQGKRYVVATARYPTLDNSHESTLIKKNKRLRLIMSRAGVGTWEWDLTSNENQWSDEIWALYGIDPQVSKPSFETWRETVIPEDREQIVSKVAQAAKSGLGFTLEWRVRDDRKGTRWLMSKGSPMKDENGQVVRYIGLVIDVTERKRIEAEKDDLERQVNHAQRLKMIGQLAGGIAHDFNNMLSVMMGHAELALNRLNPSDETYQDLLSIIDVSERSAKLTGQLLAFAQKQPSITQDVNINTAIKLFLGLLKPLIGDNIQLHWAPSDQDLVIKIDPMQLDQVLMNLCLNAKDAIENVGQIKLSTSRIKILDDCVAEPGRLPLLPGIYALLAISDTGSGVSKEHLPQIFEPFFTTKGVGKGSGMGLSTVYGIIKQHDGHIACDSTPGQGTTFRIYLPITSTFGKQNRETPKPEVIATSNSIATILLVEDELSIQRLYSRILEKEGYTVLTASNGVDAMNVAQIHDGPIDLLITDVIMPSMNGMELAKKLHDLRPALKSIFMSGYTASVIDQEQYGDRFIQKPFPSRLLKEKILTVLKPTTCEPKH